MQPQSVEAERSVIGGLLISPEGWDAIAEIVVAEDIQTKFVGVVQFLRVKQGYPLCCRGFIGN